MMKFPKVNMWKQLQLHEWMYEHSKTIFSGRNMCVWEKDWHQQNTWQENFFCHILKAGLLPFKKLFAFHLKSSFRSQDIWFFVLTFWACRKNGLIGNIRLISKFMTSQSGSQRIKTHILLNISRIKGNHTIKFGQLIEHPKRNIFL